MLVLLDFYILVVKRNLTVTRFSNHIPPMVDHLNLLYMAVWHYCLIIQFILSSENKQHDQEQLGWQRIRKRIRVSWKLGPKWRPRWICFIHNAIFQQCLDSHQTSQNHDFRCCSVVVSTWQSWKRNCSWLGHCGKWQRVYRLMGIKRRSMFSHNTDWHRLKQVTGPSIPVWLNSKSEASKNLYVTIIRFFPSLMAFSLIFLSFCLVQCFWQANKCLSLYWSNSMF